MEQSKKNLLKWWLGLAIAVLTALATYLASCTTTHSFSLNADSMENPSLIYSDSTGIKNFLNK